MVMEKVLKINYISTKIKIRRNGMDSEWKWNGIFMKKFSDEKWNGSRMEMERKWNGKFMK